MRIILLVTQWPTYIGSGRIPRPPLSGQYGRHHPLAAVQVMAQVKKASIVNKDASLLDIPPLNFSVLLAARQPDLALEAVQGFIRDLDGLNIDFMHPQVLPLQ